MSIVYFIIILLVLVVVHEYGHFQTAIWFKMKVEEFAFGFPPRLFSKIRKGVKYSFNLLPLGGYVKIKGEDGEDLSEGSFASKSYIAQITVLIAGILMNVLIAWVLFFGALSVGLPQATNDTDNSKVLVTNVVSGQPAEQAGLLRGDVIEKISYENRDLTITDPATVTSAVHDGKQLKFTVLRNGSETTLDVIPQNIDGIQKIGVELQSIASTKTTIGSDTLTSSIKMTGFYVKETFVGFVDLFHKLFTGTSVKDQVSGPIGIVKQVGQASDFGFAYLLFFAGILSINLAILNLVPFPGLDGGRILFVLIEAVTRKKVSQKVLGTVNAVGILLLLALMVLITIKDIVHF